MSKICLLIVIGAITFSACSKTNDSKPSGNNQSTPLPTVLDSAKYIQIADQGSNPPHFLSTPDFKTYSEASGSAQSSKVDIGFYTDAKGYNSFAGPATLKQLYILSWSTLRKTVFISTNVAKAFLPGKMTVVQLEDQWRALGGAAAASESVTVDATQNPWVYFETADGRHGIMADFNFTAYAANTRVATFDIVSE